MKPPEEAPPLPPLTPLPLPASLSKNCFPAGLVEHRKFTWACAGVTVGLVGLNVAGLSLWKCPFLSLTGLPCPGCGLTRSCACLLKGELRHSLEFHALGPLLFCVGAVGFVGSFLPTEPRARLLHFLIRWDRRLKFSPLLFASFLIYSLTRWWP